jgi:hypothetical protein
MSGGSYCRRVASSPSRPESDLRRNCSTPRPREQPQPAQDRR